MKFYPAMVKYGLLCFMFCAVLSTSAQVRLPQLVANNMVLQRDTKLSIWGWASPQEKVTVTFLNKKYATKADASGNWTVTLPPQKTGGPYSMDIQASNHIVLNNILIGDVWFCSGQSNMVVNMERVKERYPDEIAEANYPQIRNFFVPTLSDVTHIHDDLPKGEWQVASPASVLNFGAVSYFFAGQLYKKYHVPIGIINSSVGGTPIQAWISKEGIKEIPNYWSRINQLDDTVYLNKLIHPAIVKKPITHQQPDLGTSGPVKWYDTAYIAKGWHPFWLPGYWDDQGVKGLNGVLWFRKEINLPASMAGKPAKLFMGRIVDADETYVNGVWCGSTTYQYPPRRYKVAGGVLKAGKNLIVIRITNTAGKGGFVPQKPYYMDVDGQQVDLRGDWQYQVGQVFTYDRFANYTPVFSAQNEPTGLYNTMVAPAIRYKIKGFVWYQGETNSDKPGEYEALLKALIADWRNKWQGADLPFVYAQLPNYMEVQYTPAESKWAELREAQLKVLPVPNTAMAVAIDAGEWNDIHPLNKKPVGERLALGAERIAYGDSKAVTSGPILQSSKISGNKIVLTFSDIGSGLIIKDGDELKQFAIAGADKKFVWAKAVISGNTVTVFNEDIANPMYVRYAWANNPEGANLYNAEGLPASPFRTDQ